MGDRIGWLRGILDSSLPQAPGGHILVGCVAVDMLCDWGEGNG